MNKLFSITIISVAIIMQPLAAFALSGGPTLVAQASKTSVAVNETFTVTVVLDTKTYQVSAVDLKLTFPSATLQAQSVQAGSFLQSMLTPGAVGAGTATITLGSGTNAVQGTGNIAIITFKALAAGAPTVTFSSETQIAAKNQAGNVVGTMSGVTISIGGVQATATATATAQATATASPVRTATRTPVPTRLPAGAGAPLAAAGQVSTGPFESSVMALIVSAIVTLLYVGYTATDTYRRHEAEGIAHDEQSKTPDFADK